MPNYKDGKIYMLWSPHNDLIYIGSTTQPLAKRIYDHKTKSNACTSKILFENSNDIRIELIELCPCNNKEELLKKEGEYIRNKDCVNKQIPGRTFKEYYEQNKEKKNNQSKEYYQKNCERIKEKNKKYSVENKPKKRAYYEKNKEIIIEKAHLNYLKNKDNIIKQKKEYNEKHKKEKKEYMKAYKEKNKDKINEYMRNYKKEYEKNLREAKLIIDFLQIFNIKI